jgi:prepilin-type N-terminal cleavage/methylation domain-containing protein
MNAARPRRGFTLLETLISLALLAVLMLTINTFLFSMTELWGGKRDQRLFDQHVRAATRLVRETLEQATAAPGAAGVAIKEVADGLGSTEPRLAFLLPDAGRLADWPEHPLPDVDFSLYVDPEKGLALQWQSRLEINRDRTDLHETILSPFVKSLAYEYYDADLKTWKLEEEPAHTEGGTAWKKPARIHLRFERGTLRQEVVLDLPIKRPGASRP